jgi:hypothetical protein
MRVGGKGGGAVCIVWRRMEDRRQVAPTTPVRVLRLKSGRRARRASNLPCPTSRCVCEREREGEFVCVCVCVFVHVCLCTRARARARVCVCSSHGRGI